VREAQPSASNLALIVVEDSQLPHEHVSVLSIYTTVGLSVLAHGLTAAPLAGSYAGWYEQHPRDKAPPMESAPAELTRAGSSGHAPRDPPTKMVSDSSRR
jgi:hypothetical protein